MRCVESCRLYLVLLSQQADRDTFYKTARRYRASDNGVSVCETKKNVQHLDQHRFIDYT